MRAGDDVVASPRRRRDRGRARRFVRGFDHRRRGLATASRTPSRTWLRRRCSASTRQTCVAIEDSPTGVASALAAGCATLGVPHVVPVAAAPGLTLVDSLVGVRLADLRGLRPADDEHDDTRSTTTRAPARPHVAARSCSACSVVALVGVGRRGGVRRHQRRTAAAQAGHPPRRVGALLGARRRRCPDARERVPSMREVSPFWFNAVGVDQIVVDPNASVETDRRSSWTPCGASTSTCCPRSSTRCRPARWRRSSPIPITRDAACRDDPGVRRRWRLRRHRHRLRAVRVRRRPRHLGDHAAELGRVHRGARRRRCTPTVARSRSAFPPVYDARPDRRQWLLGLRLRGDRRARRSDPHHDLRLLRRRAGSDRPARVGRVGDHRGDRSRPVRPTSWCSACPAYGRNWPVETGGTCPAEDVPGRTSVSARSVDELIQRRNATPVPVDETGEWEFEYDLEVSDGTTTCVQTPSGPLRRR